MFRGTEKILHFLETENSFAVMGELRKQGILDKEDISHAAMTLSREDWLKFMKQKAGLIPDEDV